MGEMTTLCPECNSTSYKSEIVEGVVSKTEKERIGDYLKDIDGVGDGIIQNLQNSFSTKAELENASEERLARIDGIGATTAERIAEK